jgi:hypothetical protein
MTNPVARRLGITKYWNDSSFDKNLLYGFLKALGMHSSDIYVVTHVKNIYLYIYTTDNINNLKYWIALFKTINLDNYNIKLIVAPEPYNNASVFLSYMNYFTSLRANLNFNFKVKKMTKNYEWRSKTNKYTNTQTPLKKTFNIKLNNYFWLNSKESY